MFPTHTKYKNCLTPSINNLYSLKSHNAHEHKHEIVFQKHSTLLNSPRARIESTSAERKLRAMAKGVLKVYVTMAFTLLTWYYGQLENEALKI